MARNIFSNGWQYITLTLALMLFSAAAHSAPPLPEFNATYILKKGPLELGEMTRSLQKLDNGSYLYKSYSKPIGIARWFTDNTLTETSTWTYHEGTMRPITYRYDRVGDAKKERHVRLDFDWQKMQVTNTINNDPWQMKIQEGALDKLLYQLALTHDLQNGNNNFNYQVADGGSMKAYHFTRLNEETIETPLGTFKTIKFVRPGRRQTTIWCAPELDHLPVRIEQNDDKGELYMEITNIAGVSLAKKTAP